MYYTSGIRPSIKWTTGEWHKQLRLDKLDLSYNDNDNDNDNEICFI